MNRRLVWVDRAGNERSAIDAPGQWAEPRLSPDGRWIAVTRLDEGRQIWLHDRRRGVLAQLTRTPGVAFNAIWTPDSRAIVASVETPVYDLWRFAIDGSRTDTLVATPFDKYASSFAPDGRTMLYHLLISGNRLQALALGEGGRTPVAVPTGTARNAIFSPDGRWVAFEEVRPTGETEVVVVNASAVGGSRGAAGRRQVSAGGGGEPRWTKGGRELVYRNGFAVMAAAFDPVSGEPGTPVQLFSKVDQGRLTNRTLGYDVTPDGREFIMALPVERREALPVIVVTNWFEELELKVPR